MAAVARSAFNITPSDGSAIAFDALRVGVAGDVTMKDLDGTSVLFTCAAGDHILVRGTYVMLTGTTADNIVGLRF